jgi:opacity protein-like surface antigen
MHFAKKLFPVTGAAALCLLLAPFAAAQDFLAEPDPLTTNEWILSGHVGTAFGDEVEEADASFGGTITYLRNGMFGAEFLAGFNPNMDLVLAPTDDSAVNNYMVNAIAALPLGEAGRWQPFVSAGLGAMTIHSTLEGQGDLGDDLFDVDDTQAGGNVGVGLMGFGDQWGFRSEVRYFNGFDDDDDDNPSDLLDPADFLGNIDFWRANVGLAYRW